MRYELGRAPDPQTQPYRSHCPIPGPPHSLLLGLRPGSQLLGAGSPGLPTSSPPFTPSFSTSPLPSSGAEATERGGTYLPVHPLNSLRSPPTQGNGEAREASAPRKPSEGQPVGAEGRGPPGRGGAGRSSRRVSPRPRRSPTPGWPGDLSSTLLTSRAEEPRGQGPGVQAHGCHAVEAGCCQAGPAPSSRPP